MSRRCPGDAGYTVARKKFLSLLSDSGLSRTGRQGGGDTASRGRAGRRRNPRKTYCKQLVDVLLGFSESGKFVLAPDNKSRGGLYPEKGTGCFSLFGPRVLPEPTKADERKVSAVSFFVTGGSESCGLPRASGFGREGRENDRLDKRTNR